MGEEEEKKKDEKNTRYPTAEKKRMHAWREEVHK